MLLLWIVCQIHSRLQCQIMEISDLIKYQLNNNPKWKMEQYMVNGTGDTLMCAELGDAAYVMVPDQSTVTTAKNKINAVLAGKSADDVE